MDQTLTNHRNRKFINQLKIDILDDGVCMVVNKEVFSNKNIYK